MYEAIIKNPTVELLDDLMLEIARKTEEANEVERQYYEYEYHVQKLVDEESERTEDGKKVYRYKTDAEKVIRETTEYANMIDHKIKKKANERELSLLNQIYYHARGKIQQSDVDIRTAQHGQHQGGL